MSIIKQIHLASKDMSKLLNEYNLIPGLVYIIFFILFSTKYLSKYLKYKK